jgi:hypothetical protein
MQLWLVRLLTSAAFCLLPLPSLAQTDPPAVSNLPSYVVGTGISWTRGGDSTLSADVTVGIRIAHGQWYSWTNIATPVQRTASGSPATASSIATGGAWVPVQTGAASLIFIVQAGFSAVQANSTVAPAFITGTFGISLRLGKSNWYVMPYLKAANPQVSSGGSAVFQPGIQILYGFK